MPSKYLYLIFFAALIASTSALRLSGYWPLKNQHPTASLGDIFSSPSPNPISPARVYFDQTKKDSLKSSQSRSLDSEISPELERIFGSVKISDNYHGLWLSYVFSRSVTLADIRTIKNFYQTKNYQVSAISSSSFSAYNAQTYQTLRLYFILNNPDLGALEIHY